MPKFHGEFVQQKGPSAEHWGFLIFSKEIED